MIDFKSNEIIQNYSTVGDTLKSARIEQGKILTRISKKINIDIKYLEALERNDYHELPNGLYCEKILKRYADFLNLDSKSIKETLLQERNVIKENPKKLDIFLTKKIKWKNFIVFPKFGKGLVIIFLTLTCFTYLLFALQYVFSPPELVILNPAQNNLVTNKKNIVINGISDPETKVKINNKLVLVGRDGRFLKSKY